MRSLRSPLLTLVLMALAAPLQAEIQTRVYGGKDAPSSEWPWMAAVLNVSDSSNNDPVSNFQAQFCGGMRISREWILSAAHCFRPKQNSDSPTLYAADIAVLLDNVNLCEDCTSGRLGIAEIVIHPDWDDGSGPPDEDDIALLRLDNPGNATSSVTASVIDSARSAGLPDTGNDGVDVLGWGATAPEEDDTTDAQYFFPNTLQQVALDYLPLTDCKDQYNDDSLFSSSMICAYEPNADDFEADDEGDTSPDNPNVDGDTAGEDTYGEDSCVGDSGGPLFLDEAAGDWVAGVTSWGEGCGDANRAGVYTEIIAYAGWLETASSNSTNGPALVDVFTGFGQSARYSTPGSTVTVDVSLGNNAINNDANNALAVFDYTSSATASDAASDGLTCTTGSAANTLDCSAGNPLTTGSSETGPVDVTHSNKSPEALTLTLTADSDEEDYRGDNNQMSQELIFSTEPDMSLSFGEPSANAESASVPLTVSNKATHYSASNISFTLNLPSGLTLENPDTLNCNGSPWVCTPGDSLGTASSVQYTLELSTDTTGDYSLSAVADSDDGDFPDASPDDSLTVSFSATSSTSSGSGSSGGGAAEAWLLLLIASGGLRAQGQGLGALASAWWIIMVPLYWRRKKRSRS